MLCQFLVTFMCLFSFFSFLAIETAVIVTQDLDGTFVGRFLDNVAMF